jgi:hypothetical protein
MTETSFTVYIVAALALHLVPLLAVDPAPETLDVETDVFGCFRDCWDCGPPPEESNLIEDSSPMRDDGRISIPHSRVESWIAREEAIANARSGSVFSTTEPLVQKIRSLTAFEDIYLEIREPSITCCWPSDEYWRVKQAPLFRETPTLHAPATLQPGTLYRLGKREHDEIRRPLARHHRELARCGDPAIPGVIHVEARFEILDDGRVVRTRVTAGAASDTEIEHPNNDPRAARCIERVVSSIVFPAIDGTTTDVFYRFTITRAPLRYGMTLAEDGVFVR